MIILHGNHESKISDALVNLIADYKKKAHQIERLMAVKISQAELEQALQSQSLFGHEKVLIIDQLFSLPKSKKKDAYIKIIKQASQNLDIVLVEKKVLSASNLKPFPLAKVQLFKLSSSLFAWLDSFTPQKNTLAKQLTSLQKAIEQDGEMMCLLMFIRQIRLLIQAKEDFAIKGAPFMISKLKKQAQSFSLAQLLKVHQRLYLLDKAEKTSTNLMSLQENLEQLIIETASAN